MTAVNEKYIKKAVAGALADFADQAGPGNTNDLFYALACRLLELAHAAPDIYSTSDAERDACAAARAKGHDEPSITATWRSAERSTVGKAAKVPEPKGQQPAGGYADLAAYANSRGLVAEVFERAGWSDATLWEYNYTDKSGKPATGLDDSERLVYTRQRRALRIDTDAGPRYRLIDEDKPKPKYWHHFGAHTDQSKAWYRLGDALALAAQVGYLALVNGEASVVVAQHFGVPALCETGGGEKTTPDHLIKLLASVWPADKPIVIALDCDGKGQKAAAKKVEQYRNAGWRNVRALNLNLGAGEDIADFCRLHGTASAQQLPRCADLAGTTPQPGQAGQPQPRTQSQNIMAELARLGYTFRLNLCTDEIEVNGQPISDLIESEMRTKLRDQGHKRFGAVEDAYKTYAAANAYHPIRDYLNSLVWDGVARIGQLAACIVGQNPDVIYQDGQACPLASVYLHRWLIGAVAKVLDRKQNVMLVFTGPQGLRKSTFARWFCPPHLQERHYSEEQIELHEKDTAIRLATVWIWEVGELDATTRKADVSGLKHFITRETVKVRIPYDRHPMHKPALASLIGTVNDGSGFLADETGNRRFYVLNVEELITGYEHLDRDQLWAEAVHRYRAGESWYLLDEEAAVQATQNQQHLTESVIADWIKKHCFVTGDDTHTMTAADVVDTLRAKDVKLHGSDRALAMEISRAMAALGVRKAKINGQRLYVGIMPKL